jgi:hypothetical protein
MLRESISFFKLCKFVNGGVYEMTVFMTFFIIYVRILLYIVYCLLPSYLIHTIRYVRTSNYTFIANISLLSVAYTG